MRSHTRAVAAIEAGLFADEIAPVVIPSEREQRWSSSATNIPRPGTTVESLGPTQAHHGVHAGRCHGDRRKLEWSERRGGRGDRRHPTEGGAAGLRPLGRLVSWALAGVEPHRMGIGPVPAAQQALERASLSFADIDLIELNEAFAAQVLGCFRGWGLTEEDLDRVNVNGSGISLGHPIGATGGRILANLLREMDRREDRRSAWRRCASAAVRALRRSSRGWSSG